ncbi:MAG: hypothetical protein V3V18_10380 [Methylococcales bacterium]
MLRFVVFLTVVLALYGCANKPEKTVDSSTSFEHNPAISAEAILISRAASQQYQVCLTEQIKRYVNIDMHVRQSSGEILKACESEFNPIREAFKAEDIPSQVTERYISTKRSRSTPNILRVLMFAQSRREQKQSASEPNMAPSKVKE